MWTEVQTHTDNEAAQGGKVLTMTVKTKTSMKCVGYYKDMHL